MKETPLLFTDAMVRALLSGEKTQTRRLFKGELPEHTIQISTWHHPDPRPMFYAWTARPGETAEISTWCGPCPYGQPGDRIWGREAWRVANQHDSKPPRDLKPRNMTVFFEAGGSIANQRTGDTLRWAEDPNYSAKHAGSWVGKLRPSMFMPRWACRLELELTEVRVERLQAISEADALREGVRLIHPKNDGPGPNHYTVDLGHSISGNAPTAVGCYRMLWGRINGPGSWEANPWVWVLSFKRLEVAS